MKRWIFGVVFLWVGLSPASGYSHALNPGLLELDTVESTTIFRWSPPSPATSDPVPGAEKIRDSGPVFPEECSVSLTADRGEAGWSGTVDCDGELWESVEIRGLGELPCEVVVIWNHEQQSQTAVLDSSPRIFTPDETSIQGIQQTWSTYLSLGWNHILGGLDHLLFVLGLVCLLGATRRLIWALTAFTLAHGVSLALQVLGHLSLPSEWVESLIALSLVSLAIEVIRGPQEHPTWMRTHPWSATFMFGLLHGLGFSGALLEIGLPHGLIWQPLLAFNVGVECGQLAFALCATLAFSQLEKLPQILRIQQITGYGIGIAGIIWVVERGITL